ncbi:MAG TPA: DUF6049 family protein [Mycobacteriales bacterium]|nr:DUF6049 family protein [Mycobacteriales bacterium]
MTNIARRQLTTLAGLVVVLSTCFGMLLTTGVSRAASTDTPVQVTLTSLRPIAPQPGDTLVVHGTVQNVSGGAVSNLEVALELGDQVGSRGEFDTYADNPSATLAGISGYTTIAATAVAGLAPRSTEPFTLTVPVDNLGLPSYRWQVNYLDIAVTGSTVVGTQTVGSLRTFLPWAPRTAVGTGNPVPVAWVWPLVDRPHRGTTATWLDDDLAPELDSGGRLAGLVAAGEAAATQRAGRHSTTSDVPVTWALDPMLIGDVRTMAAGPYQVAAPSTGTATTSGTSVGTGTTDAQNWLAALRSTLATRGARVLPLPYADPDVNAAVRAGYSTEIGLASTNGKSILNQVLGASDPSVRHPVAVGWPPGGFATQRAIDVLSATGDRKFLLSDTALPYRDGQPSATPSALTPFTTDDLSAKALLTDSRLDDVINDGAIHPADQELDTERYLAETLMIQNELPGRARGLVLAPGRHWTPSPGYAANLLADAGRVPWIEPVRLDQIHADPVADRPARLPLTYPRGARRTELSAAYLNSLDALHTQVSAFAAILPPNDPTIASYTTAEQEALSAAWRSKPGLAAQRLHALTNQLQQQMNGVRITTPGGSYVTLTSHGGKVPVTIANNLDTAVRVTVKLVANQRLSNAQGGEVDNQLIQPHQVVNVDVHAEAKTSGVFPLKVQLYTPDRQHPLKYGAPVQLNVRSTVYGTITLVITGAAAGLLLIAVVVRLSRRAIAARRRPPAEA